MAPRFEMAAATTTAGLATTTDIKGKGGHKHRHKPIEEFSSNFALDRKIKEAGIGLKPSTQRLLLELPKGEEKELIADYILQWSIDYGNVLMMSTSTKLGYITSLVYLSRYLHHAKSFREMTREDIIDGYLKAFKREFKDDPDHNGSER
jgi:hypothetical protein